MPNGRDSITDRLVALERDIHWIRENLKLQAREYERRLEVLNHAHARTEETAHTYLTQERFLDYVRSEREARERATERADERLNEFIKRYETRHELVTQALTRQEGAAAQSQLSSERLARQMTLILGILGIMLSFVILLANHVI